LKIIDDKLSSHVLQLSWVKEKLEAEVNFMKENGAYTTLGVGPEASDAELARAYKVQALRLHPDRGGSTEAFQALQSAYERVLKQRGGDGKKKQKDDEPDAKDAETPAEAEETTATASAESPNSKKKKKKQENDKPETEGNEEVPEPAKDDKPTGSEGSAAVPEEKVEEKAEVNKDAVEEKKDQEDKTKDQTDSASSPSEPEEEAAGQGEQAEDAAQKKAKSKETKAKPKDKKTAQKEAEEGETQTPCRDDAESEDEDSDSDRKSEGLDDSDTSSMDAEDLEKFLTGAAAAIPAEVAAGQAEMSLQGAHMCFRAMRLCSRASAVGSDAWPQLERLASHVLEAAQHVAEACGRISTFAGSVPGTVMPLLDVVSKRSACLRESMVRQVIKNTSGLLQLTEKISGMSKEVAMRQSALVSHATAVLDMLHGLLGRTMVPTSVCEGIADVLETVARLAREAAESGAAASTAIGEAQRHAENLVEVLGAAGLWEKADAEEKGERDAKKKRDGAKKEAEDSSDEEKEPWEQHVEWTCLLQKLNGEVLALQQELRSLVSTDPALIHAVTPMQKEALFAVVAEMLAGSRQTISRAWYAQWVEDDSKAIPATFPELVEVAMATVVSASSWDKVAVPSVDARQYRLAALVDSGLLCTMLQEDLFQHAMQLASNDEGPLLKARFAEIAKAMKMGIVGT